MDRPSPTLLRLELETHAYHRDADRPWLELVAPDITRGQYAHHLARQYSIEAPFEAALAYTPHATSLLGTRMRSRLLARDLFVLDFPMGRIPARLIAPFPTISEALGWLYALERGVRLYEIVHRNIVTRHPTLAAATSYLHDSDASARWHELGDVLDRIARTPRIVDQITHAAHDAFRCMLDWYVGDEALRRGA